MALDIAGSSGWAFGVNGQVIKYGKAVLDQDDEAGERLLKLSKWISRLINELPGAPDVVVVEMPWMGKNVKTYGVLSKYVAIVQREVRRLLGIECTLLSPSDVKTKLKLPKGKTTYAQRKRDSVKRINKLLGLDLQYHEGRAQKSKKSDDDIADGIAILIAYWIITGQVEPLEE